MRRLSLLPLLLLVGCALPSEARTAFSRSTDDDGRHGRNLATVELQWPLWPLPTPPANYVELPKNQRTARTHFFAEPPCSPK